MDLTHSVQLARAAQQGDREALDKLFRLYHDQVRRIARIRMGRRIRSRMDSGDLVQNTYLVATRKIEGFEPRSHGSIIQWLARILENQIRDAARGLRAERRDLDREIGFGDLAGERRESAVHPQAAGRIPADQVSDQELSEIYDACVSELEGDYREVLLLRDYAGLDWDRITEELDRPTSRATQQLYQRARIKLGLLLGRRVGVEAEE